MPPSPALRISSRREMRAENHKRGRSLESAISYREKDDDLALFNEVQNKEKENFLLQSNDDFEDVFLTKLRYFSDHKVGISIPARGESSDLLNAEGVKNDYDWLITPPETPLFPSLEDETLTFNQVQRGRPRSQPISISRSSTMEKSYRSSRGSASPHRLSLSPQPGNGTFQSRSRPSPERHLSPPSRLKHPAPVRRPSPPPSKPSAAAARSSSPNPRRMSTGSAASLQLKGTSPVRTSRGNSASPKIRAWQSNIPGFSSEAPPNLRTSLADRPASYVRGSSPASRNGSRSGRESMSPTAARSVSSQYALDRDLFSSRSKGSVASSGDDDRESVKSIPVGGLDRAASKNECAISNNRAQGYSKKTIKVLLNSAPKRSFDMALRQMDRKSPQNMFRPLLSSVPSSTFYAGKTSASQRSMISRDSSITTSSNASSDQGTSGAHDTEENEQNQEDVTSGCIKGQYQEPHDGIFVLDQIDALNEGIGKEVLEGSSSIQFNNKFTGNSLVNSQFIVAESSSQLDTTVGVATSSVVLDRKADYLDADANENIDVCSMCGHRINSTETFIEGDLKFCPECRSLEIPPILTTLPTKMMVSEKASEDSVKIPHGSFLAMNSSAQISESLQIGEVRNEHLNEISNMRQLCSPNLSLDNSVELLNVKEVEVNIVEKQSEVMGPPSDGDTGRQQLEHEERDNANSNVDATGGAGISILLKGSSGGKGRIVQSKSFSATSVCYDDFACVTDRMNSMRSSFGYGSTSVSSSVDLGSSRQIESRIQRQLSSNKSDVENYRYEVPLKHKRSMSSLSGASGYAFKVPSITANSQEDSFEVVSVNEERDVKETSLVNPQDQLQALEFTEEESIFTTDGSNMNVITAPESSLQVINIHIGDIPAVSVSEVEEPPLDEDGDNISKNLGNPTNLEASSPVSDNCVPGKDTMTNLSADRVYEVEVPNQSSLDAISENDIKNGDIDSSGSQPDMDSSDSKRSTNELHDAAVPASSDNILAASVKESEPSDRACNILEESTVMLEDKGEMKARSLTLEEATDTILFCSSIVQNLAYEAANIAIEKENSITLDLQPTVTIVGKGNLDRRDLQSRKTGKRTTKSQKARQKKLDTDKKHPTVNNTENEEKTDVITTTHSVGVPGTGDSTRPPKLESKCNCTIM